MILMFILIMFIYWSSSFTSHSMAFRCIFCSHCLLVIVWIPTLTTDWNRVYNIGFLSITVVGNPKTTHCWDNYSEQSVCQVSFQKIKIIFSLTMYSFSTFKKMNSVPHKSAGWQTFGEEAFVYPSTGDGLGAAGEASTFRQVELSKGKIHTPVNAI